MWCVLDTSLKELSLYVCQEKTGLHDEDSFVTCFAEWATCPVLMRILIFQAYQGKSLIIVKQLTELQETVRHFIRETHNPEKEVIIFSVVGGDLNFDNMSPGMLRDLFCGTTFVIYGIHIIHLHVILQPVNR